VKLLSFGLAISLLAATTTTTGAATASAPERQVLASVNDARIARGLVPLRSDARLWVLADDRAVAMASAGVLSHGIAGSLRGGLDARGIATYGHGEVIAYTSGAADPVAAIVRLWAASPPHWALLMSSSFNYLGIGLADSDAGVTYGAIVLTESRDLTGARGTMLRAVVRGDDVRWTWRGTDPILQAHTSSLRDFAIQRRTDRAGWVTVTSSTTSTARTVVDLARGHWHGLRVRARDRAGNVGPWSAELRVWVP
jgi:hypothetical protein